MKFCLIDRIVEVTRGERIVAVKAVSLAEEFGPVFAEADLLIVTDVYAAGEVQTLPGSLDEANARFVGSSAARRLLGDVVVDHYGHHFATEIDAFDAAVTDWEKRRYFERI